MIEQQLGYNSLFIDQDCFIEELNSSIGISIERTVVWTELSTNIDEYRLSVLEWKGTCYHKYLNTGQGSWLLWFIIIKIILSKKNGLLDYVGVKTNWSLYTNPLIIQNGSANGSNLLIVSLVNYLMQEAFLHRLIK